MNRDLETIHSKQKNVKYVSENTLRSKNVQVEYKPNEDKPPPRPPRNPHVLHTVKEHANMRDDEIVVSHCLCKFIDIVLIFLKLEVINHQSFIQI